MKKKTTFLELIIDILFFIAQNSIFYGRIKDTDSLQLKKKNPQRIFKHPRIISVGKKEETSCSSWGLKLFSKLRRLKFADKVCMKMLQKWGWRLNHKHMPFIFKRQSMQTPPRKVPVGILTRTSQCEVTTTPLTHCVQCGVFQWVTLEWVRERTKSDRQQKDAYRSFWLWLNWNLFKAKQIGIQEIPLFISVNLYRNKDRLNLFPLQNKMLYFIGF